MDDNQDELDASKKRSSWSIGLKCFIGPILVSLFSSNIWLLNVHQHELESKLIYWKYYLPLLLSIILITFILFYISYYHNSFYISVIIRTLTLSFIFSLGLQLTIIHSNDQSPILNCLGLYLMILSLFHFGEFEATAIINMESVTIDSFLLNHSLEYHLAIIISLQEFALESYLIPEWKYWLYPYLMWIGLAICLFGECLRKLAMYTAGHNFNHIIQTDYQSDHTLITYGIYSIMRHPSYVGWFYWSLGTQMITFNPISLIGYAIVSWRFFKQRIHFEECTLINFFGPKYLIYKRDVPTGLPWIDGY